MFEGQLRTALKKLQVAKLRHGVQIWHSPAYLALSTQIASFLRSASEIFW